MKLSFSKLLVAFFLFGAMAFASSASAQSLNWKSEQDAQAALMVQVKVHATILGASSPGSTDYNNALQHVVYYKGIIRLIAQGETTEVATDKATVDAAGALNDPLATAATAGPKNGMIALYDEAVSFLTD